jgi:protein disulfide-isomerase A6
MVPEYEKAAKGLTPLVPMYAVDCDAEKNKMLCAEQGVKGFPTVKLFPRGGRIPPVDYPGERTSKAFFQFADYKVPDVVSPLKGPLSVPPWLTKDTTRPHLLLLTDANKSKNKKVPLLWRVLANSYRGAAFAHVPEVKETLGKYLGEMFAHVQGDKSTVLVWGVGEEKPRLYDGELKLAPLRKFLKDVVLADKDDKKEKKAEKAKDEL